MSIIESNRLIAEFLDARHYGATDEYELYGIVECIEDGEFEQHFFRPVDMKFHTSFDWLIPVVVKCFDVYDEMEDNLSNHQFILNDALLETNIGSLFKAVVESIVWYNEQKVV